MKEASRFLLSCVVCALGFVYLLPPIAEALNQAPEYADKAAWNRVAACESGKRWTIRNPPYSGGLQFTQGTWWAFAKQGKQTRRYREAADAPAWIQIAVAERVRRQDGLHHWPNCGKRWFA